MNSDDVIPAEWKEPIRNLHRSLRERDEKRSFDRCSVGAEGCKQPSIEAHSIPMAALKLIADETKTVFASYAVPPRDPVTYEFQRPLAQRSIRKFSVGRWSCEDHDRLFSRIDSTDIDLDDEFNRFLTIYRVTLRATQLGQRTVERWATTVLDPAMCPTGIPEPFLEQLRAMARDSSLTMIRLQYLKWQMDRLLKEHRFDEIDYRIARWETIPVLAGAGMRWFEGPGTGHYWGGTDAMIPAWIVLLPQQYGQVVIAASIKDMDRYVATVYRGISTDHHRLVKRSKCWTKMISDKMLENATDVAVSMKRYEKLTTQECNSVQRYLYARSVNDIRSQRLPNLAHLG